MVIMALDHVRDHFTDVRFYPLDLSQTTVPLALTRWITHFCAPTFVFLAGTGAFLSRSRGKTQRELSAFLFTRGLWLVLLEMTVVRLGWMYNVDYTFSFGQVIWAIGWSMVVLSVLVFLPVRLTALFGVAMIALHNAFDSIRPAQLGVFGWLWQILHAGGAIDYAPGYRFEAAYPLIPWIGVMAAGYAFGEILRFEPAKRRRVLLQLGLALSAGFVILRALNAYGDPHPWIPQKNLAFTFLSFLHCEKYPPSLLYLLMTLGPAIAALALAELWKGPVGRFFITFGRVPLFYYILHLFLIHGSALCTAYLMGYDVRFMMSNTPPWEWPGMWGFGLPVVYAVWIAAVVLLYFPCRWFADLKRRRKETWLSYL
jgi:uncharacterized membrane protein